MDSVLLLGEAEEEESLVAVLMEGEGEEDRQFRYSQETLRVEEDLGVATGRTSSFSSA